MGGKQGAVKINVQTSQATHFARMWWLNGKFNGIADWITVTDPTALKLIKAQPHLKNQILEIELHNGSN